MFRSFEFRNSNLFVIWCLRFDALIPEIVTSTHETHSHIGHGSDSHAAHPISCEVRILRQDGPGQASYWERHQVAYEPEMNVISVLQRIAAKATTVDGKTVAPVD